MKTFTCLLLMLAACGPAPASSDDPAVRPECKIQTWVAYTDDGTTEKSSDVSPDIVEDYCSGCHASKPRKSERPFPK